MRHRLRFVRPGYTMGRMKSRAVNRLRFLALLGISLLVSASCNEPELEQRTGSPNQSGRVIPDFRKYLDGIDGISDLEEIESEVPNYRVFRFNIKQRVFHEEEHGETFKQRAMLYYRDSSAPTVLNTEGYALNTRQGITGLASSFGANELRVEHRFFGESIPKSRNYDALRIKQSSADLHRVVTLIRPLLWASWVSVGGSKSGMTAMYHRRFYPFDTQATVAKVAPISFGLLDRRYRAFLDTVGTQKCRDELLRVQKLLLSKKDELSKAIPAMPSFEGLTFSAMPGGISEGIERAVHESEFFAWQYFGDHLMETECDDFPTEDSDLDELASFRPFGVSLIFSSDELVRESSAYFVQTEQELGSPGWISSELRDLYTFDVEDMTPFLAGAEPRAFDPLAMLDVYFWTSIAMNRTMLLYGGLDPYTAAAFGLSKTRIGEAYLFTEPNQTHLMSISRLSEESRSKAIKTLERWLGARWIPQTSAKEMDPWSLYGDIEHDPKAKVNYARELRRR